jgi:NTP pyrophosphatase (non-canonical NTP hydrolase)
MNTIRETIRAVHRCAITKGWWQGYLHPVKKGVPATLDTRLLVDNPKMISEKLMLVTCEVSEAMECHRVGAYGLDLKSGKPEGFVVELADAVIRIFDLAEALGLDLAGAIRQKHAYNLTRTYRHGNKRA